MFANNENRHFEKFMNSHRNSSEGVSFIQIANDVHIVTSTLWDITQTKRNNIKQILQKLELSDNRARYVDPSPKSPIIGVNQHIDLFCTHKASCSDPFGERNRDHFARVNDVKPPGCTNDVKPPGCTNDVSDEGVIEKQIIDMLYKKIAIYCHPDKTSDSYLNSMFVVANEAKINKSANLCVIQLIYLLSKTDISDVPSFTKDHYLYVRKQLDNMQHEIYETKQLVEYQWSNFTEKQKEACLHRFV